jgi:hypothetical protein
MRGKSGLWKSLTTFPLEINDRIVLGMTIATTPNEIIETMIAWMNI